MGRAHNHLDGRLVGEPRAYVTPPGAFGIDPKAVPRIPPDGDQRSCEVAWLEHRLLLAWRARPGRASGAALARRWGISRQTFSRVVLGQRWAGETCLALLLVHLRERQATDR